MTFEDMKNQVAFWLDDLQFGYFTETQVERWLNNACREVQKLLIASGENRYLKCLQTTLIQSQPDYDLPIDFLRTHRIEVVMFGNFPNEEVRSIDAMTLNEQDLIGRQPSTPETYFLKRNKLIIQPAPDVARLLRLYYSYRIPEMTIDNDVADIPEEYHEFPCVLAAIDGLLKDGRDISQMVEKRKYYEEALKSDAEQRTEDKPRMIVSTSDVNYIGSV